MKSILTYLFALSAIFSFAQHNEQNYMIQKGNVVYDFTFAELAIKYLETDDSTFLKKIAELKATEHILSHANRFNYNVPKKSKIELVTYLLTPAAEKKKLLSDFKENLNYAKINIAEVDLAQTYCLKYLPVSFNYSTSLFFTFGYDLGVVYGKNASVNLAHPYFLNNSKEIKYYSIHELHHAGFVMLKNNEMPSLDIVSYKEMSKLIEYFTHMEGMGTYVPIEIRKKEDALNIDKDYISLQNSELMNDYEEEFFGIYFHFKNNPDSLLTPKDWEILSILSNEKRLWYRVGSLMAQTIDKNLGRDRLTNLISEPSENFIKTYLMLKDK